MRLPKSIGVATLCCLIIPLMALMLGLVAVLLATSFEFLDFYNEDEWTQADIENFVGAPIPPSAQDIHYDPHCGIDCFVYVRFSASPADLDQFIIDLEFAQIAADPNNPFKNTPLQDGLNLFMNSTPVTKAGWWQPEQVSVADSRGGSYSDYVDNRYYTVLIDTTDPASYTLYMTIAST